MIAKDAACLYRKEISSQIQAHKREVLTEPELIINSAETDKDETILAGMFVHLDLTLYPMTSMNSKRKQKYIFCA